MPIRSGSPHGVRGGLYVDGGGVKGFVVGACAVNGAEYILTMTTKHSGRCTVHSARCTDARCTDGRLLAEPQKRDVDGSSASPVLEPESYQRPIRQRRDSGEAHQQDERDPCENEPDDLGRAE